MAYYAISENIFRTSIWSRRTIKVKTIQLKYSLAVPTEKVRSDMLPDMDNQKP
jgi:hypothetical protein